MTFTTSGTFPCCSRYHYSTNKLSYKLLRKSSKGNTYLCSFKQDQKAHEAISKVLNLAGIAKEPSLEKWASMVEISDNLHVEVGLNSRQIEHTVYYSLSCLFLIPPSQLCTGENSCRGEIYRPLRCISISLEGKCITFSHGTLFFWCGRALYLSLIIAFLVGYNCLGPHACFCGFWQKTCS